VRIVAGIALDVPFTSFTLASAVLGGEVESKTFSTGESVSGVFILTGWEVRKSFPNFDVAFIDPLIFNLPYAIVCPGATVPSWQLRHNFVGLPKGGCRPV